MSLLWGRFQLTQLISRRLDVDENDLDIPRREQVHEYLAEAVRASRDQNHLFAPVEFDSSPIIERSLIQHATEYSEDTEVQA